MVLKRGKIMRYKLLTEEDKEKIINSKEYKNLRKRYNNDIILEINWHLNNNLAYLNIKCNCNTLNFIFMHLLKCTIEQEK